jgi:hypothetical protein
MIIASGLPPLWRILPFASIGIPPRENNKQHRHRPARAGHPTSNPNLTETMKSILQTISLLALRNLLSSCTAYVDAGGAQSTTTTTEDTYVPGAAVTTQRTTTIR